MADNAVEHRLARGRELRARADRTASLSTRFTGSVLIVDDHALITHGLSYALRAEGFDVHVSAECDSDLVLGLALAHRPSLAIVDLQLGGAADGGLQLIGPLSRTTPVLVLTSVTDQTLLAACLAEGAAGIASKDKGFDRLLEQIDAVLRGDPVDAIRREAGLGDR